MIKFLLVAIAIFSAVIVVALLLVMTPMERLGNVDDVFGFENPVEKKPMLRAAQWATSLWCIASVSSS